MSRSNRSKKEIRKMAILLAVFCILFLLPMKTEAGQPYTEDDLDEGGIKWSSEDLASTVSLKIEQGKKFDIGKYLIYSEASKDADSYQREKRLPLAMIKGTKYISSAPKIISVDNRGQIQTKKTGKATIKVSLASANYTMNVMVVKKGSLPEKEEAKYWEKEVKEFKKSIPKSLNSENCLKFFYEYRNMELKSKGQLEKISMDGTIQKHRDNGRKVEVSIVAPEAGEMVYSAGLLNDYNRGLSIFDRRDKGYIEVVSMTSDRAENTITLKLKEPLSSEQIFCLKYKTWRAIGAPKKDNRENACEYYIGGIKDTTEERTLMGRTEAVLGSDTFVVKLLGGFYNTEVTLIKGHIYQLKGLDEDDVMRPLMEIVVK